jgi:hypothetical protein
VQENLDGGGVRVHPTQRPVPKGRLPHYGQKRRLKSAWAEKSSGEIGFPHEGCAAYLMTPIRHGVGRAKLCLCVSSWIAASVMFASVDASAFDCLPSAEVVKQRDPTAWPSWTSRAPGSEGKKCWYPSTRAAAHDHQKLPAHEPAAVVSLPREPAAVVNPPRELGPEVTGSASEFERARTSAPDLNSTFEDRFLAVCPIAERPIPGCGSQPEIIGRRTDRSKFFFLGSARTSP